MGLNYPANFFKSRGSVIWNNYLQYRTKQVNIYARRNVIYTLFATNKAKTILYRHITCSCSDPIYSKSKKKNHKMSHFRYFTSSLLVYSFQCKGVSHASSDRIKYLNKNTLAPNHYIVKSLS